MRSMLVGVVILAANGIWCLWPQTDTGKQGKSLISFYVSLNKKDALEGDNVLLKDLGVISGDILYVICPEQSGPSNDPQRTASISQLRISGNLPEADKPVVEHIEHPREVNPINNYHKIHNERTANKTHEPVAGTSMDYTSTREEDSEMDIEEIQVDPTIVQRCLSEPMLCVECSDGQVTSLLNDLYNRTECDNIQEALCVVLHSLMLEAGYNTHKSDSSDDSNTRVANLDMMASDWRQRAPACYVMRYTHPSCDNDVIFSLTCVPLGRATVLHGLVKVSDDKEDKCQLQIAPSDYITDVQNGASKCYRNLRKLARMVKDKVTLAMLQKYRDIQDLPPLHGLLGLGYELKLRILSYLDVVSLLCVSEVCRDLNSVSQDRHLWRRLYLTNFGNRLDNSFAQDWPKIYKTEYQRRKRKRKFMNEATFVMPPSFIPSDPYSPFAPPPGFPIGPGVIGGDYDLNPQFPGAPHPLNRRLRQPDPMNPLLRPRFDPIGPLPDHRLRPGRGGGFRDFGGPKFF
ncbi:hypothetical protein FSP39_012775 [Pinctada imbricata]|uniref:F-box domain-containing protein n=1 Tax=Pinctada imbricata TaxID=66713 RepID=A0AA89CAN0_PINIB|nr:hypothetical protein FSP39_012775 [Pinctada imbricata]